MEDLPIFSSNHNKRTSLIGLHLGTTIMRFLPGVTTSHVEKRQQRLHIQDTSSYFPSGQCYDTRFKKKNNRQGF